MLNLIFLEKTPFNRYRYSIKSIFDVDAFVNAIHKDCCFLSYLKDNQINNSNNTSAFSYHRYEYVLGAMQKFDNQRVISNLKQLDAFKKEQKDWLLGHWAYDLKNKLHQLSSENDNLVDFSELHFFIPDWVIYKNQEEVFIESLEELDPDFLQISNKRVLPKPSKNIRLEPQISREEYIETVQKLQDHIQKGDIYEVNFCQDFRAYQVDISPFNTFLKLSQTSPTPFSCFHKEKHCFLMSASPERYLVKRQQKIISQPIKGTSKRDTHGDISEQIKSLRENTKEQSENVMIVDLVRNDLSRIAQKGTVKVDELFGIYPFNQVWQMISTVSCQVDETLTFSDILNASFPMGSMTGAPKIRAMELIDQFESFKRGLFSGSVGYISPDGDFDFNVVIRSVLYDQTCKTLSVPVGSAITILSNPSSEHDECLLKIEAIRSLLSPES